MKRISILALALGLVAVASPAQAEEHPPIEPHPHLLVLGLEFDETGEPVGFGKCVDLAAGQALRLGAHHERVHFARANEALQDNAGHAIVPAAPFPGVPWRNCTELIEIFFGG